MWLERAKPKGLSPAVAAQARAGAICLVVNVAAGVCARLLLRDATWPAWATLSIDAGLAVLLSLSELWARKLLMIHIVLGLTAWPAWLHGKDFFSLTVNAIADLSCVLALWLGQHHGIRYTSYALSAIAAALLVLDAL